MLTATLATAKSPQSLPSRAQVQSQTSLVLISSLLQITALRFWAVSDGEQGGQQLTLSLIRLRLTPHTQKTLTFDGAKDLMQFANGDSVTMVNADQTQRM